MTLTVSHLTFAYPKAPPVLEDVSFTVPAGDFLSVLGANGAGKSTLFRCLLGGLEGYTGAISLDGRDVRTFSRRELAARIAYIPQIHRPTFGYSVLDTALMGLTRHLSPFQSPSKALEQQALTALERLGVAHLAQRNFAALSGGELSRLRLCMLMDEQTSFLILDEPTNHLDIAAREWVEEAVEAFDGTLLFVSHDRYFINRFATRIWELADGTITDYPMGFTQYQAVKAQEKQERTPAPVREKKGDTRPAKGNRSQQAARRQLTICENTISKLETEIADLDGQMQQVGRDPDKLAKVYAKKMETENTLQEQMARWEELSLQLEE